MTKSEQMSDEEWEAHAKRIEAAVATYQFDLGKLAEESIGKQNMSIVGAIDSNGNAWPLGSISGRFDLPEGTKLLIDDGKKSLRELREGELMGIYIEFDRHHKDLQPVDYLLKFAAAVSAATVKANT